MQKLLQYFIWVIVVIGINMTAIPVSMLWTVEAESIMSIRGLVGILIIIVPNIASLQLFMSIRKQSDQHFMFGLVTVIGIVMSAFLILQLSFVWLSIASMIVCISVSLFLIVSQLKSAQHV